LTQIAVELSAKRLELLKEAFPRIARVALIVNANDEQTMRRVIEENKAAASALGLDIQPVEVRSLQDFEQAYDRIVESRSEGIVVYPDGLTYQGRTLLFYYREHKTALIRIQHEQAVAAAAKISQFIKEIESQLGWTTQLPWSAASIEQRS
jgi:ABC-type uncharacterized transport system substrate-binding protein